MEIRRALPGDAGILSALCVEVQRLHAERLPELFKKPPGADFALQFMQEQLADPNNWFFIAQHEGEDIGYVFVRLIERPENPFMYSWRHLYIDQISVKATHRRMGCGSRLIEAIRDLANQLGIYTISLDTWSFNQDAQEFFKRAGFTPAILRLWRRQVNE